MLVRAGGVEDESTVQGVVMSKRSVRRVRVATVTGSCLFTVAATLAVPTSASAIGCTDWTPVLRGATVTQGLSTYTPLVRGKTTVVRMTLSEPSCAPAGQEQLVSAALTATTGTVTLASNAPTVPADLGPNYPPLDAYSASTATSSGDPLFQLQNFGNVANAPSTQFTATFNALVSYRYQTVAGGPWTTVNNVKFPTSTTTTITTSVAPPSHPLNVLVVPMYDGSAPVSTQFPEASNGGIADPYSGQYADTAVQNGMQALSRTLPVPDGIADLMTDPTTAPAGLRYHLDDHGYIDLHALGDMNWAASQSFCGTADNFNQASSSAAAGYAGESIASKLAASLDAWNNTPNLPAYAHADRIVGVVWQGISHGSPGCAEGMAAVNGTVAWVRDFQDTKTTRQAADTSMTGPLMSMELDHTWGSVPLTDPRDVNNDYHSGNQYADTTGYNTALAQWMSNPPSVMQYSGTSAGWNNDLTAVPTSWHNNDTLLEKPDYFYAQCQLTPGLTNCPTNSGTVGTAPACTNGCFTFSGTTSGDPEGTPVPAGTSIESYQTTNMANEGDYTDANTATYQLVQKGPGGVVLHDDPVNVHVQQSDHDADSGSSISTSSLQTGTINATVPVVGAPSSFELWTSTPPLGSSCTPTNMPAGCVYARQAGTKPTITEHAGASTLSNVQDFTGTPGDDGQAVLSPNGAAIAWVTAGQVHVQRRNPSTNLPTGAVSNGVTGSEPSWSPDGTSIAFASGGDVLRATVTIPASGAPTIGTPQTVYNHLLSAPPPLGSNLASHPSFKQDATGTELAVAINNDIWRIVSTANSANPVVCDLQALGITNTCAPVATDGDDSVPAWGSAGGTGSGLVAYVRTNAVTHASTIYTVDPASGTAVARVANAGQPAWGANLVGFVQAGDIWVADTTGAGAENADHTWASLTRLTTTGSNAAPSLTATGNALAFDAPGSNANGRDVYDGSLGSSSNTISFTATTPDDPRLLEADITLTCGATSDPLFAALHPTSTHTGSPNTAEFTVNYDGKLGCPGGTIFAQVTNGFLQSDRTPIRQLPGDPSGPNAPAPKPAIAAPSVGSIYLQYDAVIAVGSSIDTSDGTNGAGDSVTWQLSGPTSGTCANRTLTPTSSVYNIELDPLTTGGCTGWPVGNYTLYETVTNSAGVSATASTTFTVIADPNHLGTNVTVTFNPQTLYVPSSGNDVAMTVKPQSQNLANIDASTVRISQISGYTVSIPVDTASGTNGWVSNGDGSYTAKFNRQVLTCELALDNLVGQYVQIVLTGSGKSNLYIRGFDPRNPTTSPASPPASC